MLRFLTFMALILAAGRALADKADYLDLARRGWSYELRGASGSVPVRISGRTLRGSAICIVGESPRPPTAQVIDIFRDLARSIFGAPLPMRYAGASARRCGTGRNVVLRLYSGAPPNGALSDDLHWLSDVHELGLKPGRPYAATTPAQAQTFFGRRGQATHLMVQQPATDAPDALEAAFFRSILIEELFQSFSFGVDVLHINHEAAFVSKIEEFPINLTRLRWESPAFMRALLEANPSGLCEFDVLMLQAVALAPVDQTNDPAFITFIDTHFDDLLARARMITRNPAFAPIIDQDCTVGRG